MAVNNYSAPAPAQYTQAAYANPTLNQYAGKGNPYNEILYLKKQYEAGNKNWASKQAGQYYNLLNAVDRQRVQNMNATSLENWLNSQKPQESYINNAMNNQIDFNKYKTDSATIEDLQNKYGFDYSREYAKRQAEAEAQAMRDSIANQKNLNDSQKKENLLAIDNNLMSQAEALDRNYFQQYMQQAQGQVNNGLNAGIAADQDLRLAMSRQAAMGDSYRDANLGRMQENNRYTNAALDLENRLGTVNQQALAREDSLFNDRLSQAFGQIMDLNNFNLNQNNMLLNAEVQQQATQNDWAKWLQQVQQQNKQFDYQTMRDQVADNQWNKNFEAQQKQYQDEKAWREYTFNNMSASEKAQLQQNASQFGEEMAWRMYELNYNGELAKGQYQAELGAYGGGGGGTTGTGTSSSGGYQNFYKTKKQASKSSTFPTFQKHLQAAVAKGGVPESWAPALTELVGRESSWNPSAKNPKSTAYGYGQFLAATRKNYQKSTGLSYNDPVNQLIMMAQYVKDRYGTPDKALAFWDKNKWY